jgi:hypothetical protein
MRLFLSPSLHSRRTTLNTRLVRLERDNPTPRSAPKRTMKSGHLVGLPADRSRLPRLDVNLADPTSPVVLLDLLHRPDRLVVPALMSTLTLTTLRRLLRVLLP